MTRTGRVITAAVCALIFVAAVFGLVIQMLAPPDGGQTRIAQVLYLLNPVVTSVLGGYLAVQRPRHPVGWLTITIALAATVDSLSKGTLILKVGPPGQGGLRSWAGWLDNWTWTLMFGSIAFVLLLFPTGHLLSRRWRPIAYAMVALVGVEMAVCTLAGKNTDYPAVQALVPGVVPSSLAGAVFPVLLLCLVAGATSLLIRRRRFRLEGDATGMAQVRWLFWAASIVVVVLIIGAIVDRAAPNGSPLSAATDILSQIVFYGFPAAIVVAITRHGLFEIDRIVSRTVSYAVITGVLLGAYIGIIAGLSGLLPTDVNSLVVAAATLAVAALFVPVRRTVQANVDRRFNRQRHNRALLVEGYVEQLRRDVTHGSDGADLLAVVHRALEPTHAGLWLVPQ